MKELDKKYTTVLDNIKGSIQASEELKTYLEEEEEEHYKTMVSKFENQIHELYEQVANENPLQLVAFENYLLDEQFEGLYLPKVLGYSVLRGRVNDNVKYYRPQNHFRDILEAIINSSNFEVIKQRVGQSIQIGFALSSDIWITNIIEKVNNKKVKAFLQSQKLSKYREVMLRRTGLVKYRKQFQSLNFETANFPSDVPGLMTEAGSIKDFLNFRAKGEFNNDNLIPVLKTFVEEDAIKDEKQFYELAILTGIYYNLNEDGNTSLKKTLNYIRNSNSMASDNFFNFHNTHSDSVGGLSIDNEKNLSNVVDTSISDNISEYMKMLEKVNSNGYVHAEAIAAVREYYYKNEGLSIENEAVRNSILSKLGQFLKHLDVNDYSEYFEINKTMTAYMDIFSNQKFNQDLKNLCLKYIKKCLKNYKDKRSKEYQEIKKFVKSTFVEYGFMTVKQTVELFKTKRKPKPVS